MSGDNKEGHCITVSKAIESFAGGYFTKQKTNRKIPCYGLTHKRQCAEVSYEMKIPRTDLSVPCPVFNEIKECNINGILEEPATDPPETISWSIFSRKRADILDAENSW